MNRLVSYKLWDEIEAIAKQSTTKLAAIAYVSNDQKVLFGKNDVLIVDASDPAIMSSQTSVSVLKAALKRGADLYSCSGLHAKLMVLDQTAIIGSANMSKSSQTGLIEAALITDDPDIVSDTVRFITLLAAQVDTIDAAFIRRIAKLPVTKRKPPSRPTGSLPRIVLPPRRTWLVSVQPISDRLHTKEEKIAEKGLRRAKKLMPDSKKGLTWLRFINNSKFFREAKEGDLVIQIWGPRGTSTVDAVYFHAPIIYRQLEPTCTRFYLAVTPDAEDNTMSWADFQRLAKQINLPGRLGKWSNRDISPEASSSIKSRWSPSRPAKAKVKQARLADTTKKDG